MADFGQHSCQTTARRVNQASCDASLRIAWGSRGSISSPASDRSERAPIEESARAAGAAKPGRSVSHGSLRKRSVVRPCAGLMPCTRSPGRAKRILLVVARTGERDPRRLVGSFLASVSSPMGPAGAPSLAGQLCAPCGPPGGRQIRRLQPRFQGHQCGIASRAHHAGDRRIRHAQVMLRRSARRSRVLGEGARTSCRSQA